MGHQINFWALPSDFAVIENRLLELEPTIVLHSRSLDGSPRVVGSFDVREGGLQWLFFYLVRAGDLERVQLDHVPAQGYWSVNGRLSPVIEFDRCHFDGTILRRGRAYWVDGYYEDDQWREKPQEFRDWAAAVRRKIRSQLIKRDGDYISADAAAWATAGGKLVI